MTLKGDPLAAAGSASGAGATHRAVADAVAGLAGDPSLVLCFPSGLDPASESAEAAAAAAGASVAGVTGSGTIGAAGAIESGCAALALGTEATVGVGLSKRASTDLRTAARRATDTAIEELGGVPASVVLLFLDTRSGDQAEAVAGAYEVAGPHVPLAGGAAGGGAPAQLVAGEALADAVVAVAIAAPGPIGMSVAHGCRAVGAPSIVTRSEGRMVFELDGEPASRAYLRHLGFGRLDLDDSQFEALAVTHPLAQPELSGESRVRHVLRRDGEALVCATHIPPNAAVDYTHEDPEDVIATAATAVSDALGQLGTREPRAALVFDCAGRKRALAGSLSREVAALLEGFDGSAPPLAGLFTHGEVARLRGAKGDRNHAVVLVAFG